MKSLLVFLTLLLQTPTATYRVSGHVTMFPGATNAPSTLMLRSYALHEAFGQGKTTAVNTDGTFEFTEVLPAECDLNFYDARQPFQQVGQTPGGTHVARASAIGPGLNFTFRDHNVTGIEIKAPAGMNGRIVMAGGGPIPGVLTVTATTPLSVDSSFRSARSMWTQTVSDSDGRFNLGVFPGQNTIAVGPLPAAYVVKSITWGSLDVTSAPLNLTSLPTSALLITLDRASGR